MAVNKARTLAGILGANSLVDFDSDSVNTSYGKGSTGGTGTMSVYSSIDSLPSTAASGTKALVTSTNTLYIYNNGWYKIAIINAFSPQWITQPNGSYALALDGSTTTITVYATDSDDVPLTYTAVGDSDFNLFATATHDSDKHNVWTITPTDSENGSATNRTGVLTFRASDGINQVAANSTFSISFSTTNSYYTTILLKADSDSTDSQVDASTNNYTITKTGSPTSTAFSPHHPGGYSAYFDGSGDYLSISDASDFSFGTGDFTWECWLYLNSYHATVSALFHLKNDTALATSVLVLEIGSSGQLQLSTGSALITTGSASDVSLNQWHHVAVSRSGTSLKIWLDGTQHASVTNSTSYSGSVLQIGAWRFGGYDYSITGYITDARVVKGTAVYTSAFTLPTKRLTAVSGTSLLTCHLPYIWADGSTNDHTLTINGNVATHRFSPYVYLNYSKTDHGGSVDFKNGANYYGAPFSITGVDPITVEAWIYMEGLSTHNVIYTQYPNSNPTNYPGRHLFYVSSGTGQLQYWTGGDGASSHSHVLQMNTWYHVAYVKTGTTVKLYVNGKGETGSQTHDESIFNENITLGAVPENSNWFDGNISDLRINYNNTTYDSDFTPPTSPLTADSDTKLLTFTNKNDIWDAATGSTITKTGNVTASANVTKFATSSAIYFDGTNDDITINDLALSGDITFEGWFYQTSALDNVYKWIFGASTYAGSTPFGIYTYGSQIQVWGLQNGVQITGTVSQSTWHHVALVRNSGTWTLYLDGTSQGTNTNNGSYSFASTTDWRWGTSAVTQGNWDFTGFMQDWRITNGLARYTANFTPPTEEFTG